MRLVGVGSVRGAPGVTTVSLLLASALAEPAVCIEADLAGGVLATRYGLGREPGLTTLAASRSFEPDEWRDHAQDAGGVPVLVGPDAPESARALWRRATKPIARTLDASNATGVADLGRLGETVPLHADLALLVVLVRPVAEHLVTLAQQLPLLRSFETPVAVALVGDGTYRTADIAEPLEVTVLGDLPHDHRAAEALAGTGRSTNITRSRLYRSSAAIAAAVDRVLASASATERVS